MSNVYVVIGREYGGEFGGEFGVLATYTNKAAAWAHAKRFVDDVLDSVENKGLAYIRSEYAEADVKMFPLKEEFDND